MTPLTTHNLESIDHGRINDWVKEIVRLRSANLLATPDECIERLTRDHGLEPYEATLAYVMRALVRGETKWREEYLAGLERCNGAGLDGLAKQARWEYEHDEDFVRRIATAMGASAETYVHGADQRRLKARRDAATDAGFSQSLFP